MNSILKDDILIEILSNLNTTDLYCLSRVSKQFNKCFESVLRTIKRLVIGNVGFKCSDRSHRKYWPNCLDLNPMLRTNQDLFDSYQLLTVYQVLQKCPIRCIQLAHLVIDKYILELYVTSIANTVCLSLHNCLFENQITEDFPKHLYHLIIENPFVRQEIYNSDELWTELRNRFCFLKQLTSLQRLTVISSGDERDDTVDCFSDVIVETLPCSVQWLCLSREKPLVSSMLEETIKDSWNTFDSLAHLTHLYIESYRISKKFLSKLIQRFDLIGFGFQSRKIGWTVLAQLAAAQPRLKYLYIWHSTFTPSLQEPTDVLPLESIKVLSLFKTLFKSTIRDHQNFLQLFPNLRTLSHIKSGVVCKTPNKYFKICQTCHNLTFDPFLHELTSLNKLVIMDRDIKAIINVLHSRDTNLKQISVKCYTFMAEDMIEDMEWDFKQLLKAFVQLSKDSPTEVFRVNIFGQYLGYYPLRVAINNCPKNLLVSQFPVPNAYDYMR